MQDFNFISTFQMHLIYFQEKSRFKIEEFFDKLCKFKGIAKVVYKTCRIYNTSMSIDF